MLAHNTSPRCSTAPIGSKSTPNDHFTAGPDCRVTLEPAGALVVLVALQLSAAGCISPRCSEASTPNDHFTAGPDCRVIASAMGALILLVAIQLSVPGLYFPPVSYCSRARVHQEHIHPKRSFHCRSRLLCDRIGQWARWSVLVAVQLFVLGIISSASVQKWRRRSSTPNDHFTAGPDCRVTGSGSWRVGRTGGCPTYSCRDRISRQC